MKKIIASLALCLPAIAANTQIQGTIAYPTGTVAPNCDIVVTLRVPGVTSGPGGSVTPGSIRQQVRAGAYSFSLAPTDTMSVQNAYYTAVWQPDISSGSAGSGCTARTEIWKVPTSATALEIKDLVQSTSVPPPTQQLGLSQLSTQGAYVGAVPAYDGAKFALMYPFRPFAYPFTAQTSVTIPASTHGFTSPSMIIDVLDSSYAHVDADVAVDISTYAVTVTFVVPQSGTVLISGAGFGGLPPASKSFSNVTSVTMTNAEHQYGTALTLAQCYGPGNPSYQIECQISRNPTTYAVTATFATPQSGRLVVTASAGNTGIGPTGPAGPSGGSGSVLTTTASLTYPAIADGACSAQTMTLTGAATGDPVSIGAPVAVAGVRADGTVSAANTVAVQVCNSTGASYTPGTATWRATIVR